MTVLADHFDCDAQPWLASEEVKRIMHALAAAGGEARVVGGAVRDALLERRVGEVDLAVNLPSDVASEALTQAGLKVVPTGIEHGTVTAIVNGNAFEITSLRRDIETDGRRAKVAFTNHWHEDAARRDFTFNALYVDARGTIYDYFNGRDDLAQGRVRFIGNARERIQEDILRILRFFRFYAWFGKEPADAEAIAACRDLASLLPQLSVERVWRELTKLLSADNPLPALELMRHASVLREVLPEVTDNERLKTLLGIEAKYRIVPSPLRRLAALLVPEGRVAISLSRRLKLSNRDAEKLSALIEGSQLIKGSSDAKTWRRFSYQAGAENARDSLLLTAEQTSDLEPLLTENAHWKQPIFPLRGEDLLRLGMKSGPAMGQVLRSVEAWWITQDFHPSHAACLAEAKKELGKKS